MTEKLYKKIGEIMAFSKVGRDIFKKEAHTFKKHFSPGELKEITTTFDEQYRKLQESSKKYPYVAEKTKKTIKKLSTMQDFYIGNNKDDALELHEWLGFFEGSALLHYVIVNSLAKKVGDKQIVSLTEDGILFHKSLYKKIILNVKKF